jgi:formylmethanofuran dehydrogenase subunit A
VSRYPGLFAWLGDRQARREFEGGEVGHRLYSFQDWVYATRTLPARLLGLADRGHLGPGARADLALFDLPPGAAPAAWPQAAGGCRTLLKAGEVVWAEGSLVRPDIAKTTYFRRTGAEATTMVADLCQSRSFRPENLWVSDEVEGITWIGV